MRKVRRIWLNPDRGMLGCLGYEVTKYGAELYIRDCTRQVTLEFELGGSGKERQKQVVAAVEKADRIIEFIERMKVDLIKVGSGE